MISFKRKIGQNRGKPRLWIEGKQLIDAGFAHGTQWVLVPVIGGIDINIRKAWDEAVAMGRVEIIRKIFLQNKLWSDCDSLRVP